MAGSGGGGGGESPPKENEIIKKIGDMGFIADLPRMEVGKNYEISLGDEEYTLRKTPEGKLKIYEKIEQ